MNETIDPLEQLLIQWMQSAEMIPVMNDQIAQLEAVADHRTNMQEKRMGINECAQSY